jgi:hypothetical protein
LSYVHFDIKNGGMNRSALKDLSIIHFYNSKELKFSYFISSDGYFSYTISEKNVSVNIKMTVNFLDDTLYQYDETINDFDNG